MTSPSAQNVPDSYAEAALRPTSFIPRGLFPAGRPDLVVPIILAPVLLQPGIVT